MKMKNFFIALTVLCVTGFLQTAAQNSAEQAAFANYQKYYQAPAKEPFSAKEQALERFRKLFALNGYRCSFDYRRFYKEEIQKLMLNGTFADLHDADAGKVNPGNQADSGGCITEAYNRIWHIAEAFRSGELNVEKDNETWQRCLKAVIHYGQMEIRRPNNTRRFHASCFAIPTAAVNIYFCFLPQMDAVETGQSDNALLREACDMLKTVGLQAWTQPFRNDETDRNVVQIERFRKHVWWVGGNAVGYRSLLPVAFMLRSIPMVDLLAEVCQKSISYTSQPTYYTSFWNEGCTADGAGWGHGRQCLIWGYPIDGILNSLNILNLLKGTPWEQQLTRENIDVLMNYFRGSNFYYYKGFILPCLDRYSMVYNPNKSAIRYQGMLKQLIDNWLPSFTETEQQEIKALYEESKHNEIWMGQTADYNGTRWFFNNDDLVKKTPKYHLMVNMASIRCDGLESAHTFADAFNYYVTDGATLFQKEGNEYRKAFGAYDVTAYPGVTAREGMEQVKPITNWRGYCSKHNFAAAATSGGANAAAGYIFEKMNANDKNNDDKGNIDSPIAYGVKAYKGYFILGDYLVCLGAGITNLMPDMAGNIRTTIEQTEQTSEVSIYKGKGIEWTVQQGKFAYSVFPQYAKRTHCLCETRQTDWVKRNPSNKGKENLPASVRMMQLWIDHGERPVNDSYGYAVYCGEGMPAKKYPFETLRNDTLIQAVATTDGHTVGAVFYDANATLKYKKQKISVSAPCALLIEQDGNVLTLSVTDARMDMQCREIHICFNGRNYTLDMPQGAFCGKPAVIKIDL